MAIHIELRGQHRIIVKKLIAEMHDEVWIAEVSLKQSDPASVETDVGENVDDSLSTVWVGDVDIALVGVVVEEEILIEKISL